MTKAKTVSEQAEAWQVSKAKVRTWIDQGDLIAQDISPGMKRANFRIDPEEADRFWDSLSTRHRKHRAKTKPLQIDTTGDFEDFI